MRSISCARTRKYATNNDSALKFGGSFTINAWVNFATVPSNNGDSRPIVGNFSTGARYYGGYGLWFYQNGSGVKQLLGWVGFGGSTARTSTWTGRPRPTPGTCSRWSTIIREQRCTYYVNGAQQGTDA